MFTERPLSEAKQFVVRRLVCGVGTNDAPYIIEFKDAAGKRWQCPYYQRWASLLNRVYSADFKLRSPTYAACTLDPTWLSFMTFRAWMETQDWQGKELDKDLLDQGNKHYGPDTCVFISPALNKLLCLKGNARGPYPLGVSRTKLAVKKQFKAQCYFYGKQTFLGQYSTPEEAALVYKKAKLAYIADLASTETNLRIKQALLRLF